MRRLASCTVTSGQTREISCLRVTISPARSTNAMRMSSARPPSGMTSSCFCSSLSAGYKRNGPNRTAVRVFKFSVSPIAPIYPRPGCPRYGAWRAGRHVAGGTSAPLAIRRPAEPAWPATSLAPRKIIMIAVRTTVASICPSYLTVKFANWHFSFADRGGAGVARRLARPPLALRPRLPPDAARTSPREGKTNARRSQPPARTRR